MKPFNPTATCPKCGHDDIGTYHQRHNGCNDDRHPQREHLDRICPRCRYEWPEACIPKARRKRLETLEAPKLEVTP